jgi:hypothetical protein
MMRFKWRYLRADATAVPNILRGCGNTSSIILGNGPSIMARGTAPATID